MCSPSCPWLIHVNVLQKALQYCKVISHQLIKIKKKRKKRKKGQREKKEEKNVKDPTETKDKYDKAFLCFSCHHSYHHQHNHIFKIHLKMLVLIEEDTLEPGKLLTKSLELKKKKVNVV